MRRNLKGIYLICFLLIGLLLVGCSASSEEGADKVAIVNGQTISTSEFDKQLQYAKASTQQQQMEWNEEEMEKVIIDLMVGQTLLLQEAEKAGIQASAAEIQENLDMMKSQFQTEEEFNQALGSQNFTLEQLEEEIFKEISINSYIKQTINAEDVAVTDEEISTYYEQYKASIEEEDAIQGLDELKPQIEQMLGQQKVQQAKSRVIEGLKVDSEIETFI